MILKYQQRRVMYKSITILATVLMANIGHAYKVTDDYVIFESGDEKEVSELLMTVAQAGGPVIRPYVRNEDSKKYYDIVDEAVESIHQTYLELYNVDETDFPLPYVVLSKDTSLNMGTLFEGEVYATNFINLGLAQISGVESIYTILAHEIAHYFHKHSALGQKYLKVSYSENRDTNAENGYGENIGNDPELKQKLILLDRTASIYASPNSRVADLKEIKIGQNDPMFKVLFNTYKDTLFVSSTEKLEEECLPAFSKLGQIYTQGLNLERINDLNSLIPSCTAADVIPVEEILKNIFPANELQELIANPANFADSESEILKIVARSLVVNDTPIATALKIIYGYRLDIQRMVNEINWDQLQIYTPEDEADITAFKILNKMGLAEYQLSFINLLSERAKQACIESIKDDNVDYYGGSEFGTHHSVCWRVNRTIKMLKDYNAIAASAM